MRGDHFEPHVGGALTYIVVVSEHPSQAALTVVQVLLGQEENHIHLRL